MLRALFSRLAILFSSFGPTPRLAVWLAVGALLWVGAAFSPAFEVAAVLYLTLLAVVALLDFALSPHPSEFEISRETHDKLNLGTPNAITLAVYSRAASAVALRVRDEPPAAWPIRADKGADVTATARADFLVAPNQEARTSYSVVPTRRGVWEFGALSARYTTKLGLWFRQFRRPAAQSVRVYPDISEVGKYELHLRNGRTRELGLHLQKLRGKGSEYESLREYTTDDNFKDINWKASARRGKLISTNYEVERDQTVILALDCGRMMTALADTREKAEFQTPLSKLDCAINAAVLLTHVSVSLGDAVGLLLFADGVLNFVPPRKGKTQTGLIIDALYGVQPSLVEPDYGGAYNELMGRRIRRALVVTFTDLIDPDASRELLAASGALRRHHNPLCVTINNRDVMDLAAQMPRTADDMYAKAMAQRMLSQRTQALRELSNRGVGILDVEASQLTVSTVNRYLDLKARAAL
ncbi:MAG TPA: DUF58 domain-containing protein [Abditibacteriaceae bacterium]|jgi:uncharacterized protein (DUF58 family)